MIIMNFRKKAFAHFFVSEECYESETADLSDSRLSHYYVHPDLSYLQKDVRQNYRFDEKGIPVTTFPDTSGDQYNPVKIAQYALAVWEIYWVEKDEELLQKFLSTAEWFVQNQVAGKWQYHYEDKVSNLPSGWISGMAQGQAISVLLRAYTVNSEPRFLATATAGMKWFEPTLAAGGVTYRFDDGNLWFEEYPNPQKPAHVFNGHVYALFGIWDYYRVTKNEPSRQLFERGVNAVVTQIHKYDNGYWVLYDQRFRTILNASYLDLHIRQLEILNALRNDPTLQKYRQRWNAYFTEHKNLTKLTWKRFLQKYCHAG